MNSTAGPERMGLIEPEKMTGAQKKVAADIASGPRGSVRGPFNVLPRHVAPSGFFRGYLVGAGLNLLRSSIVL
jgi:hypothetical protein